MRAGTFLFLTTSILCAMARDMDLMWLMRGLQGIAAASGPVIARAIVRDRYQGNRASQVMSTLSGAMAVIPMVAPSIGALILTVFLVAGRLRCAGGVRTGHPPGSDTTA